MKYLHVDISVKVILLFTVIISSALAKDSSINVTPSYVVFQSVATGQESRSATIHITNSGYSSVKLGDVVLEGTHSNDFNITNNGCTQTLNIENTCNINVKFNPTSSGVKSTILSISYGDGSDKLSVFLTNQESNKHKVKNLLPPVMNELNILEEMNAGGVYNLNWSALGYHDDYDMLLVMFDCTGMATGTCGSSYSNSEKLYESIPLSPSTTTVGAWDSNGITATNFNYTHSFIVPATRKDGSAWAESGTPVVVRFYNKSSEDSEAGNSSLSLIIPGGLTNDYYDTSGRIIQKTICPASGCTKVN